MTQTKVNTALRDQLVAMEEAERRLKNELAEEGILHKNYPKRIRALHLEQANTLEKIIEAHGWPTISLVGKEGAHAAWLTLQHAISRPDLMKRLYPVFEKAVENDEADIVHLSCLTDALRFFSREPQVFGHYFDWDANGKFGPWPIEDPDGVNERRRQIGLGTIEEQTRVMTESVMASNQTAPADHASNQAKMDEFLRQVGWLPPLKHQSS